MRKLYAIFTDPMKKSSRFVAIQGHFYQPPREDPWTGELPPDPSAAPDHDWNERIARECYIPNGRARVAGRGNEILRIVNNYQSLNFDFGPTLTRWYAKKHPDEYRRIVAAFRESALRLGHGNALGHPYHHSILPLLSRRDRMTELRWGLADFRRRFGRGPEGLWLPEMGADDPTLHDVASVGIKFVVLTSTQLDAAAPLGSEDWKAFPDVGSAPLEPFAWSDGSQSLALFFSDADLSRRISFERLLSNAESCAESIAASLGQAGGAPRLLCVATDGETFGHHQKFADMGLAYLFLEELPKHGVSVTNFASFLAANPPRRRARLKAGSENLGVSWSCAHGTRRWRDACGCGSEGKSQAWKRPFFDAMRWLNTEIGSIFIEAGREVFRDPWAAREDYGEALADPSRHEWSLLLSRHLKVRGQAHRAQARALLEMERHALAAMTSCAWFFTDIGGIEAVLNLKNAARAVELARETAGIDIEPELRRRLAAAPSNDPAFGTGEGVYLELARPPEKLSSSSLM